MTPDLALDLSKRSLYARDDLPHALQVTRDMGEPVASLCNSGVILIPPDRPPQFGAPVCLTAADIASLPWFARIARGLPPDRKLVVFHWRADGAVAMVAPLRELPPPPAWWIAEAYARACELATRSRRKA